MWPWGHAAVAYLAHSGLRRRSGRRPTATTLAALAAGTALPDVVDKTLAWTFAVLPTGRTLAHSLLVLGVVLAAAAARAGPERRRRLVVPFGVGSVSHALVDVPPSFLAGDIGEASFLLWPVLPSPTYEIEQSFGAHLLAFALDPYVLVQFGLAALAGLVWAADGYPGVETVRARVAGAGSAESGPGGDGARDGDGAPGSGSGSGSGPASDPDPDRDDAEAPSD